MRERAASASCQRLAVLAALATLGALLLGAAVNWPFAHILDQRGLGSPSAFMLWPSSAKLAAAWSSLSNRVKKQRHDRAARSPLYAPSVDGADQPPAVIKVVGPAGGVASSFEPPKTRKLMLVLVMTRVTDFAAREWLREWYATSGFMTDMDVIFPLGLPTSFPSSGIEASWNALSRQAGEFAKTVSRLKQEEDDNRDLLVMTGFVDSYENLAVKSETSLRYVSQKCADSYDFIVKSDVDMPPNYYELRKTMRRQLKTGADMKLFGLAVWNMPIIKYKHKNQETADIPFRHFWPYCSGPLYYGTPSTFKAILSNKSAFGVHKNEDAFMGYLAHYAGVSMVSDRRINPWFHDTDDLGSLTSHACSEVLAVHRHSGVFKRVVKTYEFYKRVCTRSD